MITEMKAGHLKDIDKPSEPFEVIGKIIPRYENENWTFTELLYEAPYLKSYQDEEDEEDMRRQVPIEKAPQRALRFLKRVKRTRLIAAILSALVALFCIGWLYDLEFHYANTEAGRLEAVCDYIPSPEGNTISGVEAGTPVRAVSWQTIDNHLLIFFAADNEENVHGVMHLYSVNPVQILFLLCDFHKKYILCVLKLAAVSASHCTLVIKAILTNLFTKTLYISNIELYLANF